MQVCRLVRPSLARLGWFILSLLGPAQSGTSWAFESRPEVVVEIDARAGRELDPRLTRRLISLELREVEVPARVAVAAPGVRRSLFVRVLGEENGKLRVELWEHGEFCGARVMRSAPGTSRYLRAQRVGLVAAELARRLRHERLRQARQQAQARAAGGAATPEVASAERRARIGLRSMVRGALVGPGEMVLGGTGLQGELRVARSALGVGAAWLSGLAPRLPRTPRVEWLEVSMVPSHTVSLAHELALKVEVEFIGSSVQLTRVRAVDAIPYQAGTWSARAAAAFRLEHASTQQIGLWAGPEVGGVLRRLRVTSERGTDHRLGGLWLGLSLGLTVEPGARGVAPPVQRAAAAGPRARGSPVDPPL